MGIDLKDAAVGQRVTVWPRRTWLDQSSSFDGTPGTITLVDDYKVQVLCDGYDIPVWYTPDSLKWEAGGKDI